MFYRNLKNLTSTGTGFIIYYVLQKRRKFYYFLKFAALNKISGIAVCCEFYTERMPMILVFNIILNLYSLAILLVINFHALKFFDKDSFSDKVYILILRVTAVMLGVDILSRLDGFTPRIYFILNHIGNFLLYLMCPFMPSLWLIYVHYQVFRNERGVRKLFFPILSINAVNVVTLVLSQFFGWFYYIDSNNIYHRGPYFLLSVLNTFILIVLSFMIIFKNHRKLEKKKLFSLIFFAVPPFFGIMLQILFYGISFVLNSVVISLVVVFLNIQNCTIYTDYLTGLSNRKKLDAYLKEKISQSNSEKTFSAILIDINNFKNINDTFGHNMGDHALWTAARLLKSCLRTGDFIARYGGDEFCIILDISNKDDLEALAGRIYSRLEKHNNSGANLYRLEISMGYAVYDYEAHKTAEEFLNHVDTLMYENKQAYKNKSVQSAVEMPVPGYNP